MDEPTKPVNNQIENNFTYHEVKKGQLEKYKELGGRAKSFAGFIDGLSPDSREKSLAMTNIEQAVMWANASIARS